MAVLLSMIQRVKQSVAIWGLWVLGIKNAMASYLKSKGRPMHIKVIAQLTNTMCLIENAPWIIDVDSVKEMFRPV